MSSSGLSSGAVCYPDSLSAVSAQFLNQPPVSFAFTLSSFDVSSSGAYFGTGALAGDSVLYSQNNVLLLPSSSSPNEVDHAFDYLDITQDIDLFSGSVPIVSFNLSNLSLTWLSPQYQYSVIPCQYDATADYVQVGEVMIGGVLALWIAYYVGMRLINFLNHSRAGEV